METPLLKASLISIMAFLRWFDSKDWSISLLGRSLPNKDESVVVVESAAAADIF